MTHSYACLAQRTLARPALFVGVILDYKSNGAPLVLTMLPALALLLVRVGGRERFVAA